MSNPAPVMVPPSVLHIDASSSSSQSVLQRISDWTSDHKAVVYTIAGVTVVATAAGAYYYYSSPSAPKPAPTTSGKKKSKGKKKAKKDEEKQEAKGASAASGDLPLDINELTEQVIASLTEQVRIFKFAK
jgi:mitochondrial import receptor subunit TOM70